MNSSLFNVFYHYLLKWFEKNKRIFPWRKADISLYEILIVEILLRKTKAEMVSEFYPKFIKKYPDIGAINKTYQEVLENDLIPLGLYITRARLLKDIAREIINSYGGKIPKKYDELIKLKGIGKYIANAFLCFGLNQDVVLVDTNVKRVFSRLYNKEYPTKVNDKHPLWEELVELIPRGENKKFFTAILDFGALVCKKKKYICKDCPLISLCKYNKKIIL